MAPTVTVIAPGMMGSAVAKRLTSSGLNVRTSLSGRSAATIARAAAAGMARTVADRTWAGRTSFCRSYRPVKRSVWRSAPCPLRCATRRKSRFMSTATRSARGCCASSKSCGRPVQHLSTAGIIGPPPEPDWRENPHLPLRPGCWKSRHAGAVRAVDPHPARTDRCGFGHENFLLRFLLPIGIHRWLSRELGRYLDGSFVYQYGHRVQIGGIAFEAEALRL